MRKAWERDATDCPSGTSRSERHVGSILRRTVIVAASAVLVVTGFLPQITSASHPCSGLASNWFDGMHSNYAYATYSSKATITPNVGAICTGGSTGASAAWAMVADGTGYAQSGYARMTGVASRYFSQYRRSSAYAPTTVWGASATATKTYATIYGDETHHLNMWVGSSLFSSTNFDPVVVWSQPWDSQFFGETWKPADDMPGIESDHADFTVVRYSPYATLVWTVMPSAQWVVTGSTRYHKAGYTDDFDIWTYPLQ